MILCVCVCLGGVSVCVSVCASLFLTCTRLCVSLTAVQIQTASQVARDGCEESECRAARRGGESVSDHHSVSLHTEADLTVEG